MEKVQEQVVRLLIIVPDCLVLQVRTCSHKTVYLVWPPLHNILDLDSLLPFLYIFLWLVLTWEHREWDRDTSSIVGVDHRRMARSCRLEWSVLLRDQVDDLAAPAVSYNTPFLDVGVLRFDLLQNLRDALQSLRWSSLRLEEFAELLSLFLGVWWVPRDVRWFAIEEVLQLTVSFLVSILIDSNTHLA